MAFRLDVPPELQRNSKAVTDIGIEETGLTLLDLATERLGLASLAQSDILDIGCGVRFAQTIVNRGVPIRSYTGIEVHQPIVEFMRDRLEPNDPRFRFVHWDVQNGLFNESAARRVIDEPALPVTSSFDVVWLYSVFTHLDADDARAMLRLTRQVVRPNGALLFTAFVDPQLDGVESRSEAHPLMMVFYGLRTMETMIGETGWMLRAFYPGGPQPFIQPCFVCAPAAISAEPVRTRSNPITTPADEPGAARSA